MGCGPRLVILVVMVIVSIAGYYLSTREVENPVTGEVQRISLTQEEEIALGLNSRAEMARLHGGLHPDEALQVKIDEIGLRLVEADPVVRAMGYRFEFHLLADEKMVNAFALPGGQIFITYGLLRRLGSEDEVAGVLAHEIGHVVGKHSNEQMAKAQLSRGLVNAVVVAGGEEYGATAGQAAAFVAKFTTTSYSREHELESDQLGVRFMLEAGYQPEALIRVMEVLAEASAGRAPPEFLSTHPSPANRIERIREHIEASRARLGELRGR